MKKVINIVLGIIFFLSLVLLFWPFVMWNNTISLILRIIPSFAIQLLLCRTGKYIIIKFLPFILTGIHAIWGIYLYFTSAHWVNATVGDLIADYISPFICCIFAYIVYLVMQKKK